MIASFLFTMNQKALQMMQIPFQVLAIIGAYYIVHACLQLKRDVKCRFCHKPLGYLLYAYEEYPKRFMPRLFFNDFPDKVALCPYCHQSIDQEA